MNTSADERNTFYKAILQSTYRPFRRAVDSTASLIQSALQSTSPLLKGMDPYPTVVVARNRFLARRFKLLKNLLMWRKVVGDMYGVGSLVGEVVERLVEPVIQGEMRRGGMGELEGNVLRRKVRDLVPGELMPKI